MFKCAKHNNLVAVYSYYNVATTITFTELMNDALILARISGERVRVAVGGDGDGDRVCGGGEMMWAEVGARSPASECCVWCGRLSFSW